MITARKVGYAILIGINMLIWVPILSFALLVAASLALEPEDRISSEEIGRLKHGMTREEVVEICGVPSRQTDDRLIYYCAYPDWFSDPVCIGFDEDGRMNWFSQ